MPREALQLIRIGERFAFHGPPMDGVPPIRALLRAKPGASQTVSDAGLDARPDAVPDARLSWLLGVCLGAAGRYGSAFDVLTPLASLTGTSTSTGTSTGTGNDQIASLASSTLGSLYRQIGLHAQARSHDEEALRLVLPFREPDAALVEARIGLAADAVGLRELPRAEAELAAALHALPGAGRASKLIAPEAWRVRARSCWVRAEVALLTGDPALALVAARESVRLARAARAPRHEAKGLLFASVAQAGTGRLDTAAGIALTSMRLSVQLGAWPLVWPAGIVLSDLLPAGPQLDQALALSALAVDLISEGLPEPMSAQWRAGADVQRLLQRASVPG